MTLSLLKAANGFPFCYGFLLQVVPADVCLVSPGLRMGRADLLPLPTPKSTQLIQGQSPLPPISFKRPILSSAPCQFVVNLHVVTFDSLKLVSSVSRLHV